MPGPEFNVAQETREIVVPSDRVLRHFLHTGEPQPENISVRVVPTSTESPPIFHSPTYLANIGSEPFDPLLLELRFVPTELGTAQVKPDWRSKSLVDDKVRIALLMTNERYWSDLASMGEEMYKRVKERGISFDALIAPEVLGPKLSQEIARIALKKDGQRIYLTSLQKGKPRLDEDGRFSVGPPKPWVEETAGIPVSSGTSHLAARQMLFLDQDIAAHIKELGLKVLLVDDALLTRGTLDAARELLTQMEIPISGIATVLNEGSPIDQVDGIPYVWLTKLPLFASVPGGLEPIPGTFDGLDHFYIEQ